MTDDLETRLRAALHNHADEVSENRLTRTVDDAIPGVAGPGGRRTGHAWLAAAAAAVVGGGGATGIVLATRPNAPAPEPVATVTVTPTPAPTSPPTSPPTPSAVSSAAPGTIAPREEPRSAIPWGQVGPGWSAASWATSAQATTATLYLVSRPGRATPSAPSPRRSGLTTSPPTVDGSSPGRATRARSSSGTSPPGRPARSRWASRARPTRSRTARRCSPPTRVAGLCGCSDGGWTGRSRSPTRPTPALPG